MFQKLTLGVFILTISIVLAGCPQQAKVYNVEDAQIVANVNDLSSDDVRKAIIRGGAGLGWKIRDVEPGLLEGTLNLRSHEAIVSIPYTDERFSIIYKDSKNLRYDGELIHSNYNGWIQNLENAIIVQLQTI